MSSSNTYIPINPGVISYFVGHDPNSVNEQRKLCVKRMQDLFKEKIERQSIKSLFLKTEDDIFEYIQSLPREYENFSVNPFLGESQTFITQENVRRAWNFWHSSMGLRSNLNLIYGNMDTQIRRFSLNLAYLVALDAFVRSNCQFFLTFEDDAMLREDFIDVLAMVLKNIPEGWDVFNFVNKDGIHHYKSSHRILDTELSITYLGGSAAGLLWSRKGARAVLSRMLIEVKDFEFGDPNGDMNIDALTSNLTMQRDLSGPGLDFSKNFSNSRSFKSYTFVPEFSSPVEQIDLASTWR
jgi:hypothetical protein